MYLKTSQGFFLSGKDPPYVASSVLGNQSLYLAPLAGQGHWGIGRRHLNRVVYPDCSRR